MLKRLSFVLTTMALAGLLFVVSCSDPEPGEVSFRIKHTGKARSCTVQVYNTKGNQIQEVHSDQFGVAYVKELAPGAYTFKFLGMGGEVFPATAAATVRSGGNEFIEVELTQAGDAGGGAAAS